MYNWNFEKMVRLHILVLMCIMVSGCAVYRVADIPVESPVEVISNKVHIYVAVKDSANQDWQSATELAADLQKAGYKPIVVSDLSLIKEGDLIVSNIEPWGQCFSEPLLTVISLGIIPHIGCSEFGHAFTIHRKGSDKNVRVNAKFTVKVMVGWLTLPFALGESYAYSGSGNISVNDKTKIMLLRQEITNALQQ